MINGILFIFLMAVGFIILFVKFRFSNYLHFVSVFIFIALGFMLFSEQDITIFVDTVVQDNLENSTTWYGNDTYYLIGDTTTNYNENSPILAVSFIIFAIVLALVKIADITDKPDK